MKKIILLISAMILVYVLPAQVVESDYAALKKIYMEMGGEKWIDNSGWDFSQGPESVKAYNKDTGEGWFGINEISKGRVTKLELIENNVTGTISDAVWDLTMLRTLNLCKNSLTGTLSERVGEMKLISSLDISGNELSGGIPASIAGMGSEARTSAPNAEGKKGSEIKVYLHKNAFTGSVPAALGQMSLLFKPAKSISVDVSGNRLTGELPDSLLELVKITSFKAAYNQLTGKVPAGLADLPKLKYLRLEKNKFSGEVPRK